MSTLSANNLPTLIPPGTEAPSTTAATATGATGTTTGAAPSLLPTTTIYIGKIPAFLPADLLDALLALFAPAVLSWRRANDPLTGAPKAFGFAEFSDAAQADVARRVFEALAVPSAPGCAAQPAPGAAPQRLLVKVDAAAEEHIAEDTARTMATLAVRVREADAARLAALPPGMEAVALDDAAVQQQARAEYLRTRDERVAALLARADALVADAAAAAAAAAAADPVREAARAEASSEERARAAEREATLARMEEEDREAARQHHERERERAEKAYAGHLRRYAERERERLRRISVYRATIHGIPACKRKRPLTARERADEQERDRRDREAERAEQEQKEQEGAEQGKERESGAQDTKPPAAVADGEAPQQQEQQEQQ